jgi:aminomethyltransferase
VVKLSLEEVITLSGVPWLSTKPESNLQVDDPKYPLKLEVIRAADPLHPLAGSKTIDVVNTPWVQRTALAWREWAGYVSPSTYESLDVEYAAIRTAAALIDVSPLYKYRLSGPDTLRLVDRVITRQASLLQPGRVIYSPWCDEAGRVVDDGTLARLDDGSVRWTAADPQLRWLELNAGGLDVTIDDVSDTTAVVALQGPLARAVLEAATGASWADLRYYRRRGGRIDRVEVDVTRTGYTGDLGYEIWVASPDAVTVWDALVVAGAPHRVRPAGLAALDLARVEAGLILLEVDYTSARHALSREQAYSPFEIGLGRLVALDKAADFVGRRALVAEQRSGGPPRRLVGLELDWADIEALHAAQGLPPTAPPVVSRTPVPVFADGGGRQIGRVTSSGWSPILKTAIALASVPPERAAVGTRVAVEWTVEARRGRVTGRVVELPFLDLPRKRA